MLAVHEAIHHRPRKQGEVGDPRQQRGIEEGGRSGRHDQSEERGVGTAATSFVISVSVVTFSDCA